MVVSFVTTDCPITCIVRTLDLDKVASELHDRAVVLCIAMDGAHGDLRSFADGLVGPSSPLRFVAGDAEWTASLAARVRSPTVGPPGPPSQVLLFDRRGQIAMSYGGDPLDRPRLERDIAQLHTFERGLDRSAAAASHDL